LRWPHLLLVASLSYGLLCPARAAGQMPPAEPADVGTIEGIVHAYYDVINGPAGVPR
jgi:hypothetical protein